MSELDDAIGRLEAALARLEAASRSGRRPAEDERVTAIATEIAGRIDAALAKLGRLLDHQESGREE